MAGHGTSMGRRIGEKAVKASIAVVGLLVLRLILSALPMLKHPIIYMPSLSAETGAVIPSAIDFGELQQAQQAFRSLSPAQVQQLQQAFGSLNPAQSQDWQKTYDQLLSAGNGIANLMANSLLKMHFVILPITIANAIIDTLIFLVLMLFGRDLGAIVRAGSVRVPEMGSILNFAVMASVVALAYRLYQGILYPFLLPDHTDIYGWIFLALGLAPLVGIVVLISRNMDSITSVVMHPGNTAAAVDAGVVACSSCGRATAPGAKFCPHCAAPLSVATKRFCPSCGSENSPAARFCGDCGGAIS